MRKSFRLHFAQEIQWEKRKPDIDEDGESRIDVYGDPVDPDDIYEDPVMIPCRIDNKEVVLHDKDGTEVISSAKVYLNSAYGVSTFDRFTLPDHYSPRVVECLRVEQHFTPESRRTGEPELESVYLRVFRE